MINNAVDVQLLDGRAILAALPEPLRSQVDLQVRHSTGSTNDDVRQTGATGALWPVCMADHQTAGRGRRGRPWLSVPGSSVALSVLWRTQRDASALGGLSLVVGLAVVAALEKEGGRSLQLKWPNDVLAAGRKLGGM